MASATIFSLWYKCLNFIDIIFNANYCNDTWKKNYQATNHKIESLLREKYQKP